MALSAGSVYAQQRSCSSADAEKADQEAGSLRDWDALYRSWQRFGHCDDGSIGEGYSESVARILVEHWEALPKRSALSNSDLRFQKFVVRHIDATLDIADLRKIRTNARSHCLAQPKDLCKLVALAAERALKENGIPISNK